MNARVLTMLEVPKFSCLDNKSFDICSDKKEKYAKSMSFFPTTKVQFEVRPERRKNKRFEKLRLKERLDLITLFFTVKWKIE